MDTIPSSGITEWYVVDSLASLLLLCAVGLLLFVGVLVVLVPRFTKE